MSPIEHIEKGWPDAEKWGYMGPGWYFWCEDWANCVGPYRTEAEAKEALAKYCVELDKSPAERCIQYRQQLYGLEGPGSEQEVYEARIKLLEDLVRALYLSPLRSDVHLSQEQIKLLSEVLKSE